MSDIKNETKDAIKELLEISKIKKGDILIIGCSSSEIMGEKIGSASSIDTAQAVFDGICEALDGTGVYPAFQCCEHLNRAVVVSEKIASKDDIVNVVPQKKAGGSLATIAYNTIKDAVVVEKITADAGIDIGNTLIGMHLRRVAVPVRISTKKIGEANVVCARTRPRFIGGERAAYNDEMK